MEICSHRRKCIIAFVGAVYLCSLLEGVISSSVNKALPVTPSSVLYVQAKSTSSASLNRTDQLNYRRHRRKLPNESSDQQFNSLDEDGLQFQEYQGVFGRPGVDFPVLSQIPITKFNCRDVKNSNTGYYADLDTHCQVFHVCDSGRKVSFLCPNGTIFRQSHLICDWWFRVECERSPELYEQSVHMLEADQHLYKQRAAAITNAMHNLLAKGEKESAMHESPISVTNSFNSESGLPRSTSQQEARPTHILPDNPQSQNVFASDKTNRQQNGNNFVPNLDVTLPAPSKSTFEYQFVPVTSGPSVAKQTEQSGRNLGNINQPANANLLQTKQKGPNNGPNAFSVMNFDDFKTNTMIFTQPTSNTFPVRTTNSINATPSPLRLQTSNWAPFGSYNSIAPPPNNFNTDRKKNNAAYYSMSQPINVPNFTPGKYPLSEQKFPTTRFSAIPPRFTVQSTLTPPLRTNYDFQFTTNSPPRTSFTKSFFTVTNDQHPVTTPSKTNTKSTAKLQLQTGTAGLTSLTTPATPSDSNYFREQQILAETASFAGNGKHAKWQDYYLNQNYNSPNNQKYKLTTSWSVSQTPTAQTTTPPEAPTTFSLYNMLFDSQFANNSNQSYALYFPSNDNVIDLLNLVTPEPDEGVTDLIRNFSKPAVSELLLNSFATHAKLSETTPTEPAKGNFPILLRNETKEAYDQLFPSKGHESTASDLLLQNSNGIVQSSSPKTVSTAETLNEKLRLKSTPDFRELAQIFSRALSAYLEDPEQFRKILSEVRPTEPPTPGTFARHETAEDEVLAFSEDERIIRKPNTISSTSVPTLRNPETFAEEINNFMFDPLTFHTDSSDFNVNETYYPSTAPTASITFTVSPITEVTKNRTLAFTSGTTQPNLSNLPSTKANLYDDQSTKFVDNGAQNLQDEPLLITADTQSFFASENLVRYPLHGKFASKYTLSPPNLKSPAYPQFGVRTSSASFTPTSYISSRADVVTTSRTTQPATNIVTAYKPVQTTLEEESLRTTINLLSPGTRRPLFNESAVNAMVDMMQEAKTNPTLRNKLVLLLVNNGQIPENRSVKDLKLKLLKALLVPVSTKEYDTGYTEQPVSRRKVRKEGRVPTAKLMVASTTPQYRAPTDLTSKSIDRATTRISRTGRATATPVRQNESDGLTDTDSRAIDLLKTLYSVATNNWNR